MASEESMGRPINYAAHQFHQTANGIRELLDLVDPHLGGEDLNEFLKGLDSDQQGALALVFVSFVKKAGLSGAFTVTTPAGASELRISPESSDAGDTDSGVAVERAEEAESDPPSSGESEGATDSDSRVEDEGGEEPVEEDGQAKAMVKVRLDPSFSIRERHTNLIRRLGAGEMPEEEVRSIVRDALHEDMQILDDFAALLTGKRVASKHAELVNRSMLITAVAAFETLLTQVLARQFELFPGLVGRSEMQFSLADLEAFGSIEDARAAAIERRVESIMAGDFDEWESWLTNNAKISLSELCIDRAEVIEVFQRRHVAVHNDGRASRAYINKTKREVPINQRLPVDKAYLNGALDALDVLGVALACVARAKWIKEEKDGAAEALHGVSYDLLERERHAACVKLADVGCGLEAGSDWLRRAMQVNAWIARKEMAGSETIRDEVLAWDVSALAPEFALARAVLLEDLDAAFEMLPGLLDSSAPVSVGTLEDWPLYAPLRGDPRYEELRSARGV
jgi:hypothetical protein